MTDEPDNDPLSSIPALAPRPSQAPPQAEGSTDPLSAIPALQQQPAAPGPAPQNPAAPTDGLAIAALVLAILAGPVLGLVFGFVALNRTKDGARGGRGLAKAAIAISVAWIVAGVIAVIAVVVSVDNAAKAAGLSIGDCFDDGNVINQSLTVQATETIPCGSPHRAEVVAGPGTSDLVCTTDSVQLTNATRVSYEVFTIQDPANDVYWCAASVYPEGMATSTGLLVTGSFAQQNVQPVEP